MPPSKGKAKLTKKLSSLLRSGSVSQLRRDDELSSRSSEAIREPYSVSSSSLSRVNASESKEFFLIKALTRTTSKKRLNDDKFHLCESGKILVKYNDPVGRPCDQCVDVTHETTAAEVVTKLVSEMYAEGGWFAGDDLSMLPEYDLFVSSVSVWGSECIETKLDPDEKPLAVQAKFPSSPTFSGTASNTALNFFALRLRALDDSDIFVKKLTQAPPRRRSSVAIMKASARAPAGRTGSQITSPRTSRRHSARGSNHSQLLLPMVELDESKEGKVSSTADQKPPPPHADQSELVDEPEPSEIPMIQIAPSSPEASRKNIITRKSDNDVEPASTSGRPSFLRWSGSRGVTDPKSESLEPVDTPEPQQSVVVVGGTLDMVIDNLVSLGVMDADFYQAFILTFRHVVTPEVLLEKLLCVFDPDEDGTPPEMAEQLRTTNFVLKWMDGFWMDFQDHPRMITMLETLMAKLTMSQLGILALRLRNVLTQKLYGKEWPSKEALKRQPKLGVDYRLLVDGTPEEILADLRKTYPKPIDFLTLSHRGIANFLTAMEFDIFEAYAHLRGLKHVSRAKIGSPEFTNQIWQDIHPRVLLPHLPTYIRYFNKLSFWAASQILSYDLLEDRVKAMEKIIFLGKELYQLQNYNGLYAVLSGLHQTCVNRLRITKQALSSSARKALEELEAFFCPDFNFSRYRIRLKAVGAMCQPAIPVMSLVLRDLTMINEVPKLLDNGHINFRKLSCIYGVIKSVERFQDIPYEPETLKAEVTPEIRAFCTHLIDEKVEKKLYERSYQLEPRIPESQARSSAPPARGS